MKPQGSFLFEKYFSSFLPNIARFLANIYREIFSVCIFCSVCLSVPVVNWPFYFPFFQAASQVYIIIASFLMAPSEAKGRYMPATLTWGRKERTQFRCFFSRISFKSKVDWQDIVHLDWVSYEKIVRAEIVSVILQHKPQKKTLNLLSNCPVSC